MINKEKLVIFPFDLEFAPVLQHLNDSYDIVGLCTLNCFGKKGDDLTYAVISNDFENLVKKCNTVLFIETGNKYDYKKFIYPRIIQSIHLRKNIISFYYVEEINEQLINLCKKNNVYLQYFYFNNNPNINDIRKNRLLVINSPIILIQSMTEQLDKFAIQLAIKEGLTRKNYKVVHMGSRSYCEIINSLSFPKFMFDNNLAIEDKIILFNNYVSYIEKHENPDVILIGVPGSLMKYDDIIHNNFGIFNFIVAQAIRPDYVITSLFYNEYEVDYFDKLALALGYRYGYQIDCFNIANKMLDFSDVNSRHVLTFCSIDSKFIDNKLSYFNENSNIKLFNIKNNESKNKLIENILDKLISYGDIL
jgi:peptide maturation system protein (TIGR04066 family)